MRAGRTGLACAACALVLPAIAFADANVSLLSGTFDVTVVERQSASDGNHGIIVEPFFDGRNGFRVRPDLFGRPAFSDFGSNCDTNFVVNDVVCSGSRTDIEINGGDGADTVVVSGTPGGREGGSPQDQAFTIGNVSRFVPILNLDPAPPLPPVGCLFSPPPVLGATIDLGSGNDFLLALDPQPICVSNTFVANAFLADLDADGRGGNDAMAGALRDDRLGGGFGDDTLFGGGGNDTLLGGPGDDRLNGESGDDLLDGGSGGDLLQGASGQDTLTYESRTEGIRAIQDALPNDGETGEGDNVDSSVEIIVGGSGNDVMGVSGGDHRLIGNDGSDQLTGGSGGDRLEGGAGPDALGGGLGVDAFFGGSENDFIEARDGVRDGVFSCGPGNDTAFLDLQDVLPVRFVHNCEFVDIAPADDGHPSHGIAPVRVSGTAASVQVLCPRAARIACRGALTVRTATGRRVLGRGRYDIAVGRTVIVQVRLASRPGAKVVVETKEQGLSKKGPRSSNRLLRVSTG